MSGGDGSAPSDELRRGSLMYLLATPAKFAGALFFILAARAYGEAALGVYVGAWAVVELCLKFGGGGLGGTATFRVSELVAPEVREQPDQWPEDAYRALKVVVVLSAVISSGAALALSFGVQALREHGVLDVSGQTAESIQVLALTIPLHSLILVCCGATRGLLLIRYDMWVNHVSRQPLLLMGALALLPFGFLDARLAWAQVGAHALGAVYALYGFVRHIDVRRVLRAKLNDGGTAWFAIKLTGFDLLSHLAQDLDRLMLVALAVAEEELALYGVCASIVFTIRTVRRNIARVFQPMATGYIARDEREPIAAAFNDSVRWSAYAGLGFLGLFAAAREPILWAHSPAFVAGAALLPILGVAPVLEALFGFYETLIGAAGRVGLMVVGMGTLVLTNFVLNLWWIPQYGVFGAAYATLAAYAVSQVLFFGLARALGLAPPVQTQTLGRPLVTFALPLVVAEATALAGLGPFVRAGVFVVGAGLALWLVGLHHDDRAAVQGAIRKLLRRDAAAS